MARTPSELLQGTVDILILRTLAWESMHGYAISRWLTDRTDGVLAVDGAALYQALHRLEHRKFVAASWGLSENNRKAKFYRLTTTSQVGSIVTSGSAIRRATISAANAGPGRRTSTPLAGSPGMFRMIPEDIPRGAD